MSGSYKIFVVYVENNFITNEYLLEMQGSEMECPQNHHQMVPVSLQHGEQRLAWLIFPKVLGASHTWGTSWCSHNHALAIHLIPDKGGRGSEWTREETPQEPGPSNQYFPARSYLPKFAEHLEISLPAENEALTH